MKKPILKSPRGSILFFVLTLISLSISHAQQRPLKKAGAMNGSRSITIPGLARTMDETDRPEAPEDEGDNAQLRRLYELELLQDPATGQLPEGIREKELQFAQRFNTQLKNGRSNARTPENWKARGPFNVGGRTRAIGIDVDNENILLAGGVSGGMWRSVDGGMSWNKATGSDEIQSVTSVVQDPRAGFHNIWYYATGERLGNSASGSGAFFAGNGLYKSVDNGVTWSKLIFTADDQPQTISPYDLTFNLAIHPVTGDLYMASWWGIHRSTDGGATFTEVLATGRDSWTDVIITPGGAIYVTTDSDGTPNKGIFRSADGNTWSNITPAGFPAAGTTVWGRTVLGYTPTNENVVYAYADNGLADGGAYLWRYTHDTSAPAWANLSANLPAFGGNVGNLDTQGGYNMIVKVHPSNPAVVFIGATNLYRSSNGFTSTQGTAWIGGYSPANNVSTYPNQHPDQHVLIFYPSDPKKAISGNDGGIQSTNDILASNAGTLPVQWFTLNNGFLTTQPYALSFDPKGSGDQLMAGFQDNGSWFTNSNDPTIPWTQEFTGDGSYNAFADGGLTRYVSSQQGTVYRENFASADDPDPVSFTRVTPAGATGFAFVAPFILDPNDDNIMYMPDGTTVWRNDNLDGIPLFSNAPTSVNWNNLVNTQVPAGNTISALDISTLPANRLYYGTNKGLIFRVDNANIGYQMTVDISTGKGLPVGYVNCITVDPSNADRVFAVFSNYNILSIFFSDNGGTTWTNISGNLEETSTGKGSGPSVRWLAVEGNDNRYYVGTSIGLFSTTTLAGTSTVWKQEDPGGIGNVVVPMVRTREDGFVAIAAHGNGLYSATFTVTPRPQPSLKVIHPIDDFEVFVNSPNTIIDIHDVFKDTNGNPITFSLINTNPSLLSATINGNLLIISYVPGAKGKGSIGLIAKAGNESLSEVFTITVRDLDRVLYSQNTIPSGSRPSQLFTDFDSLLAQTADDFQIPIGQTWSIENVFAAGGVNGKPELDAARVIIYSDNAGTPGREVYNSGVIVPASGPDDSNLQLVLPSAAKLNAGKYWISVYVELAFGDEDQWFWTATTTVTRSESQFKDEGDLFGTGAVDWTPSSLAFGGDPVDMLYTLSGKATGAPTPARPTNLDASTISSIKFDLTWSDNSSNELAFLIERSTNGKNFTKRATVGANETSYADTDIFDPLLTYYYRVAAIGLSDTSAFSNVDATAIIPKAPKATFASYVFQTSFVANWQPSVGASYYALDVSSDDFVTFLKGYQGLKVKGTSVLVKGTHFNKHYQYRVRAVNAGGESENSNTITVASVRNLKLNPVCSDNPTVTRRWLITNPNPFDVPVEWFLFNSNQYGAIIAPPGQSFFTTSTIPKFNTVIIFWQDDFQFPHLAAKLSTDKQCANNNFDLADARQGVDDDAIDTESPFLVSASPNPAIDKLQVLIASPFEDDVELEIYSTTGNLVFATKMPSNATVTVDVEDYPSGVFILKAKQSMYNKTIKLVKK